MKRKTNIVVSILFFIALPLIGYAVTYGIAIGGDISGQDSASVGIFYFFMILALLAVPYWMVKLFAHAGHTINPREKEFTLGDVPKDKQQLDSQARV